MRSEAQEPDDDLVHRIADANDRLEARAGRNLPLAIGVGLLIGAITLACLLFSSVVFSAFVGVVAALCCSEIALAVRHRDIWIPRVGIAVGGGLGPLATGLWGPAWGLAAIGIGIGVLVVWDVVESWLTDRPRDIRALGWGCAFLIYIAVTASAAVALEGLAGPGWVLGFLIVVIVNDTCAYAVGRAIGRHPLAPRVSPHKTWEGQGGAAVGAVAAGAILALTPLWALPWWAGAINGAMLMVSATCGDLLESRVKRWIGVKDMSSWIPGHGGLLDRLDAMLLSAPVALGLHVLWALVF